MPLNHQHEPTKVIGRFVCALSCVLLSCCYWLLFTVCIPVVKIPTDPRPLTSLAVGFGVCGDTAADKEGSE